MLPLYEQAEKAPDRMDGNTGLWYDKFCDGWCYGKQDKNEGRWTLGTKKIEWIAQLGNTRVGPQELLAEKLDRLLELNEGAGGLITCFKTCGRFVTGLGLDHPVENGFAWHHTLGVPYLPGSSIKGIVKTWAGQWRKEREAADEILGSLSHGVGTVVFLDAVPISPVKLETDVMTPHYSQYYRGSEPPGDWLSPNPIPFLAVADGQSFAFAILPRDPKDSEHQRHCAKAKKWLTEALDWLGAGAKTAVGYGHFEADQEATEALQRRMEKKRARRAEEFRLQEQLDGLSPAAQEFEREAKQGQWDEDKNAFVSGDLIESWLERMEAAPDEYIIRRLIKLTQTHFSGELLTNPGKLRGKKKKEKFTARQQEIAKRINALRHTNS